MAASTQHVHRRSPLPSLVIRHPARSRPAPNIGVGFVLLIIVCMASALFYMVNWTEGVLFIPEGGPGESSDSGNGVAFALRTLEVGSFHGHTEWVSSVVFSSDGKLALSGSSDNKAILWNVEDRRSLQAFVGHTGPVTSVCFSPDERHVLT